jgi:disulfide bond formation protein DsbB
VAGDFHAINQYDLVVSTNRRLINFAGFIACVALLGYAYYSQYKLGLEPCPLCIFQRIGVAALALVFLISGLHNPRGWGSTVYAALIGVAALATIGVAIRHLYVQSLPPGTIPACGAPLDVLLQFTPVTEVIRKVLTGSGECSQVNWKFLGLAMPAWVLIWALVLGALGILANTRPRLTRSQLAKPARQSADSVTR